MANGGDGKNRHFILEGVTETEGDSFVQHGGSVVTALRPGPAQVSVSRDMGVRPALRAYLDRQELASPDTTLIEELGLCQGLARIDLATVGGVLHGYEIKTNRDRLSRLASQAETYSRVFDRVTLVVGTKHHNAAAGVRSKPRPAVWNRVCEVLDLTQIRSAVRHRLRNRAETSTFA